MALQCCELELDAARREAVVQGRRVRLTRTEFRLAELLSSERGRVFTRRQLIDAALGQNSPSGERTIDVHVANLRRKLGPYGRCIETVRGIGFRFREPPC